MALTKDGVIGVFSNKDVVQLDKESIIQDGREHKVVLSFEYI